MVVGISGGEVGEVMVDVSAGEIGEVVEGEGEGDSLTWSL